MINNQLFLFLLYLICGIIISGLFDFFRSLRKEIKSNSIIIYAEDIIFWLITTVFLIFIINKYSLGQLRLFIFLGLALGALIYYYTMSNLFIMVNHYIINMIKKFIKLLNKIFRKPVYFFIINIRNIDKKILKKTKK